MRIAAALILTLASSVALADPQPHSGFIGETVTGHDWIRQPISGFLGESADGHDWVRSPAPDSSGGDASYQDGGDWVGSPAPGVYGFDPDGFPLTL
ncbi:MAG: hypothetical protein OES38_12970 [Gammaproteobacteria bacterium]|nr:hypothetical protein [Gammaproteobacteria bacterium]